MKRHSQLSSGFTLIEVMIASMIAVVVIGGATMALVNGLRSWRAEAIRSELHIDLEIALERIRNDLRLSSVGIGLMAFYPADAAEYTAISFPLATPGADGLLPRDAAGNIIWDTTVIYHVRPGSPDEFIRTMFRPRNPTASPEDFYNQLVDTVESAILAQVQAAAMTNEVGTSRVIFRNLVDLAFRPPNMRFDGYAPQYERARRINWGGVVLSNGVNELTFTVQPRNDSTNHHYDVGIDRFALSYSGSPREGEMFLPVHSHPQAPYFFHEINRGSVIAQDMSSHGARWSGNSQLTFRPPSDDDGPGSELTFHVENDLWTDTNFDNPPGVMSSNCSRNTDIRFTNQAPFIPDVAMSMDNGISWDAENVTDGVLGSMSVTSVTNVNVIHGGTNIPSAIRLNGTWVRFAFYAGLNHNLYVRDVVLSRRAEGVTPVPGTERLLRFGGNVHVNIAANARVWTDWVRYEIERDESYLIAWQRRDSGNAVPLGQTDARVWVNNDGHTLSYLDGVPDNRLISAGAMEVRFPSNAVFRSGVFDTRVDSPTYRNLTWTQVEPWPEGDIDVRVRSAGQPDMSDATAWYPGGYFQNNGNNNIGAISGGRYVQYEALFTASGDHLRPAILRDVTITWDAPTGIVDLLVDFARGPDYGIVTAQVNGQAFIRGISVDLEIFREGPLGMVRVPGTMEVRPLNTGR